MNFQRESRNAVVNIKYLFLTSPFVDTWIWINGQERMEQACTKRNIYIFGAGLFQAARWNEGQYVREDVDQLFHIIFKWATPVAASCCN